MPQLIVIGGPTASGKTALSIQLATALNAPILSADSRQFYKEMRIGNARPEPEELAAAQHYFIADRSVANPLSAGAFEREALALMSHLFKQHEYLIMVGGSGLYIDAVTEGLNEFPTVDAQTREKVNQLFQSAGLEGLQKALKKVDPLYFAEVDQQNPRRLQRALEVSLVAGKPYSSFRKTKSKRAFTSHFFQPNLSQLPREKGLVLPEKIRSNTPDPDRLNLYARIERRLDIMLTEGLLEEVKTLFDYRQLPALQTVGYQEFFPYLAQEYDLNTATSLAKRNSRRYAKRQLTWFNREGKYQPVGHHSQVLAAID